MTRLVALSVCCALLAFPIAAQASDGSRQAAGGGFMSSYISDPYHDPRSLHSQRNGTGQILGQPMLSENAGAQESQQESRQVSRRNLRDPHWAAGTTGRRAR